MKEKNAQGMLAKDDKPLFEPMLTKVCHAI